MKGRRFLLLWGVIVFLRASSQEQATPFTLADRDRIIQTQVKVDALQGEMNARFEDVNKRIDQTRDDVNKRLDQTNTYIGWMIALFAAITAVTIGFAVWDRRTMIRPFESKVKGIESDLELKGTKVENILSSLRELAKTDNKLAEVLRSNHLL